MTSHAWRNDAILPFFVIRSGQCIWILGWWTRWCTKLDWLPKWKWEWFVYYQIRGQWNTKLIRNHFPNFDCRYTLFFPCLWSNSKIGRIIKSLDVKLIWKSDKTSRISKRGAREVVSAWYAFFGKKLLYSALTTISEANGPSRRPWIIYSAYSEWWTWQLELEMR